MASATQEQLKIFLAGDVMTGRGIDQVLPHPAGPELHEICVSDARYYVTLAERKNGDIPQPVDFEYPWGEALGIWQREAPDLRIVNLETSITVSDSYWTPNRIHYRMHPRNVPVLNAAGIDCCTLANNHVLDWGYEGLRETLDTLRDAGIAIAGAGRGLAGAARHGRRIRWPQAVRRRRRRGPPCNGIGRHPP